MIRFFVLNLPAIALERNFGVGSKILSENFTTNSIFCPVRRSTNNGLLYQADSERRPWMCAPSFIAMPANISALVISPPSLFPRSRKRTMHVRTFTVARARLAPDGQANFENSCTSFIRKPLRTSEMVEMSKMAKVLVLEQHSHFFTIQPVSIHTSRKSHSSVLRKNSCQIVASWQCPGMYMYSELMKHRGQFLAKVMEKTSKSPN